MCYTGGPYCTKPALAAYKKAQKDYDDNPSAETKTALDDAKKNYLSSPGGIEKLRESGKTEEANKFEALRNEGIARAKEADLAKKLANQNTDTNVLHKHAQSGHYDAKVAVANNPGVSMRTLQHIVDHETSDDFRFAIARHPKATPEMVNWAAKSNSFQAKELALQNPNVSRETIRQVARDSRFVYMRESEAAQTGEDAPREISVEGKRAGQVWKKARTLEEVPSKTYSGKTHEAAAEYVNRSDAKLHSKYAKLDSERFGDREEEGAKFSDKRLNSVEDVVALTAYQRRSLEGDDRDKLIKFGASPEAFSSNRRYLLVQTPGKTDSQHIKSLPVDSKISIERGSNGISLVAGVKKQADRNFGVVVIGKQGGKEVVLDAYPGMPVSQKIDESVFEKHVGRNLSINHIMEIAGTDNVNVKTRLK